MSPHSKKDCVKMGLTDHSEALALVFDMSLYLCMIALWHLFRFMLMNLKNVVALFCILYYEKALCDSSSGL